MSSDRQPDTPVSASAGEDLEDYWSQLYPELARKPWTPLQAARPFDPADQPTCGGQPTNNYVLFYCVPDDYVGFDAVKAMPQIYMRGGDFAVATLIATQYGLAALIRDGQDADAKITSLRADCLAGGWVASVLLQNRPESPRSSSSAAPLTWRAKRRDRLASMPTATA
ncbi:hypothetical protein GCM10009641_54250 [Mycobacterium cookii]|uniref:Uncharacterized protein n=1 Tax=Mycobacterium cookii TaxID=1775 RepID=A0A7I7KQR7_9MYCO|nr:hypothetical protein [Mycobacterium cookii]MCV7332419.1 hypothetical protein [Mycobacterium cookii]BBX44445.1 hypothetical protein MCOO_04600 [Mycobacterium cookii]